MRIGILTFHRSYNYGAYMQCFSLVKRMQREFPEHSVEVIDYSSEKALKRYEELLQLRCCSEETKEKIRQRNKAFIDCQEQLPLSKEKIISDDIEEVINYMNENYDVVIAGSDAIWNWNIRGFPNAWFLKGYNGIKMSYAASVHGMEYQKMTDEQKFYIKDALQEFRYIGVRDITTEQFVEFVSPDLKVHHNCDPTMFLRLEDIPCDREKLKKKLMDKGLDLNKPIIGIMADNSVFSQMLRRKYKKKVQLVALYEPNKYADVFLNDLSPYEWALVFSFFKATATHFFHGTMLSLVNDVPVLPIEFASDFSSKYTTKIKDLMTRLDLIEWRNEADYRNISKVRRILKRLAIWPDRTLWKKVYRSMDDVLTSDYSQHIQKKKEKERKSSDSFFDELRKIIKENGE